MEYYYGGIIVSYMEVIVVLVVQFDFVELFVKLINLMVDYFRFGQKGLLFV